MKKITGSILILLVLVQTFTSWVIVAEYSINKDYIAKNLCENKTRPKLHCNGKCQLMKKLAEEEKQNSPAGSPSGTKIKLSDVLFTHEITSPAIAAWVQEKTDFTDYPVLLQPTPALSRVFHPPATA
jgi:hypothetical protein